MNAEMVLARQHNLYFHAYSNYQALFRVLAAVRFAGWLALELCVRQWLSDP